MNTSNKTATYHSPAGTDHKAWLESLKPGDTVWWTDPDAGLSSGEFTVHRIDSEHGRIFDDTIFLLKNEAGSVNEVLAAELCEADPNSRAQVTMRLVLDVTYTPNGVDVASLQSMLESMCTRAIGNGMLTGHTEAEVDSYSADIRTLPEPLSEDDLASFMMDRIENGELDLSDIPTRLARYGLMEPGAFMTEMRERMEQLSAD